MTENDALSIAVYVLHHVAESKLKAGEIISHAIEPNLRPLWFSKNITLPFGAEDDKEVFAAQLSLKLGQHVRNNAQGSRVIDGTRSGWRLGPKAAQMLVDVAPNLRVTSNKSHLGLSGEYAVMSELLALDWNVAKPPIDNGVDLFATKDGEVRTVQVKTATLRNLGNGSMRFSGSYRSHRTYNNIHHYYVLVFRTIGASRWECNYYVVRSLDFDRTLKNYADFNEARDKWTLEVRRIDGRYFIGGTEDITVALNRLQDRFN